MTRAIGAPSDVERASLTTAGGAARGWYLYGITRRGALAPVLAEADADQQTGARPAGTRIDAAPLQLLESFELAAVVRPVPLADFIPTVLQERLRSDAAVEEMVRSHNRVIAVVHRRQAILPAKFGSVYAREQDVRAALQSAHDALLRQLDRLEGCDEWAVHLYVDRAVVRERISERDAAIRQLRDQHAAARPGRAYFLERQLRDELEDATQQALLTIAQEAFDRLARAAVAAQVSPVREKAEAAGGAEILRAAFLVARDGAEHFQTEVHVAGNASDGLRSECTGPWPPYSFAGRHDEEAQ